MMSENSRLLQVVQSLARAHATRKSTRTAIDYLTLYKSESATDPLLVVYQPRIYIIIQGAKAIQIHRSPFRYDENHYLVATVDLPISGHITHATPEKPYLAACIAFAPEEISRIIAETRSKPRLSRHPGTGLGLSKMTEPLLDVVRRLLLLLDNEADRQFLAPMLKRELIYRVLQGDQCDILFEIADCKSDVSRINSALAHLRAHFAEKMDPDLLPKLSGMGKSTFYRKFQGATGLSPVQYRKRLRLQEARRLMLDENRLAVDAGFSVGYESPSQFIRDYRAAFGLPPHQDVHRIRSIGLERYREINEEVWV